MVRFMTSLMLMVCLLPSARAAIDAYPFPDEQHEVRYQSLIAELRCPNCLNTNLAGSDAMIAEHLRREVHRMLLEGKSDDEILSFMYERYGDFILYEPRLKTGTLMLWFGPLVLGLLAGFVFLRMVRRRAVSRALTAEEQQRLESLLQEKGQ